MKKCFVSNFDCLLLSFLKFKLLSYGFTSTQHWDCQPLFTTFAISFKILSVHCDMICCTLWIFWFLDSRTEDKPLFLRDSQKSTKRYRLYIYQLFEFLIQETIKNAALFVGDSQISQKAASSPYLASLSEHESGKYSTMLQIQIESSLKNALLNVLPYELTS